MLSIQNLTAGYDKGQVLQGVSLEVGRGEILALLGRNGSGRSTLAKAIMGLVPAQGRIEWRGQNLVGKKTFEIARLGLGYVPESRDVFPELTVEQNLMLGTKNLHKAGRWALTDLFGLFPQLEKRLGVRAGVLSGGEQQMLTLCRTLMGDPDLIVIDEPTEGLAPQLLEQVGAFLKTLRLHGVSVLLMEQKLTLALSISDRCAVLGHGRVVYVGAPEDLLRQQAVCREWLAA
jgi:branched-chain amino acid transport system ATP-binding protein